MAELLLGDPLSQETGKKYKREVTAEAKTHGR
jgi:hypothetical protein